MFDVEEKTGIEKIKQWFQFRKWDYEIFVYNIKQGFKNLVDWIPIIWLLERKEGKDQYSLLYFYYKEKKKRSDQKDFVDPRVTKSLFLITNTLKRLNDEEYTELAGIKKFRETYGTPVFVKLNDGNYTLSYGNPELTEQAHKELNKIYNHSKKLEKQDIDYLATLLKKYDIYL